MDNITNSTNRQKRFGIRSISLEMGHVIAPRPDTGGSPHRFEKSFFSTPTWCRFCDNFIWGLSKKGFICKECGYVVHKKCLENVPDMCNMDRSDYKKTSNPLFKSASFTSLAEIDVSVDTNEMPPQKDKKKEKKDKKEKKKSQESDNVGSPFNVVHNTHVDFNFTWTAKQEPTELFEFKEELGKGAYGGVFKAIHKETGFPLAVKVIPTKQDAKVALAKEVNVLKKCKNANILSYYGSVIKDNEVWILMDCCNVGSVKDLMKITLETLDEEQIAQICIETLRGLAYLHEMKIIHCDVKAANILLTNNGQVKLADFGVSEQIQRGTMKITPSDFVGSPLYMAPEVIQHDKYNNKADIWSLAISLIEMAEGRPPNYDITNMTALLQLPKRPPPKLKNPKLWSPMFNDFLAKALVKDPESRPDAIAMMQHPFAQSASGPSVLTKIISTCLSIREKQTEGNSSQNNNDSQEKKK